MKLCSRYMSVSLTVKISVASRTCIVFCHNTYGYHIYWQQCGVNIPSGVL